MHDAIPLDNQDTPSDAPTKALFASSSHKAPPSIHKQGILTIVGEDAAAYCNVPYGLFPYPRPLLPPPRTPCPSSNPCRPASPPVLPIQPVRRGRGAVLRGGRGAGPPLPHGPRRPRPRHPGPPPLIPVPGTGGTYYTKGKLLTPLKYGGFASIRMV